MNSPNKLNRAIARASASLEVRRTKNFLKENNFLELISRQLSNLVNGKDWKEPIVGDRLFERIVSLFCTNRPPGIDYIEDLNLNLFIQTRMHFLTTADQKCITSLIRDTFWLLLSFNNGFLRERGMASTPKMDYQTLFEFSKRTWLWLR